MKTKKTKRTKKNNGIAKVKKPSRGKRWKLSRYWVAADVQGMTLLGPKTESHEIEFAPCGKYMISERCESYLNYGLNADYWLTEDEALALLAAEPKAKARAEARAAAKSAKRKADAEAKLASLKSEAQRTGKPQWWYSYTAKPRRHEDCTFVEVNVWIMPNGSEEHARDDLKWS